MLVFTDFVTHHKESIMRLLIKTLVVGYIVKRVARSYLHREPAKIAE